MIMNKLTYALLLLAASSAPLSAQTADELLTAGREAFMNYDYARAAQLYSEAKAKGKKNPPAMLQKYQEELTNAENFMSRVEKVVILDSITVPKSEFFKYYRIPAADGSLGGNSALPFEIPEVSYVFTSESGDNKLWSAPDANGVSKIWESIRLVDGNWSDPVAASPELPEGSSAIYPFMMSDGITLYFAANTPESLGGYDLFIATRDPADGKYRQPLNMGMPYNSPYDDYMMAIDEVNGIGWWATDRNRLGDKLTIYVFKLNDLRSNYNPDETPDLANRAFIRNYRNTWEKEDYSELLERIAEIPYTSPATEEQASAEFRFPAKGGGYYTSFDDFKSSSARTLMKRYLMASTQFKDKAARLADLRRKFATSKATSLRAQIRTLETEVEKDRAALRKLRSDIYRIEFPKN